MQIEIVRERSDADRIAGARLSRMGFGPADVAPLYVDARRLQSPIRAQGTTWLALVDGQPASALLRYELLLRRGDEALPAFGLGSVATDPAYRKQGLASRLCAAAAEDHGGPGLLYSGIDPAFYERLGYTAAPAWDWRCDEPRDLADSGPRATLVPLDPRRSLSRLSAAWRNAHDGWYLDRDEGRWRTSFACNSDNVFYAVGDAGYLRMLVDDDGLEIVEFCVSPQDRDPALRAAAALAVETRANSVSGWFEPTDLVRAHFRDEGRTRTLPMLCGADAPGSARFASSDYF